MMNKQAESVADEGQKIGRVQSMQQNPMDDSLIVFIGTKGINWVTEDCGANIKPLNTGKSVEEISFHPTQRNWALAASWTECDLQSGDSDDGCRIFKELYYTKNMGQEWTFLTNYVFDFEWGYTTKQPAVGEVVDKIPEERIFFTREPDAEKNH